MNLIKIKIIKSSSDKYWYIDRIGEEFVVTQTSVRDYYVSDSGKLRGILVCDVEVLNEKRED